MGDVKLFLDEHFTGSKEFYETLGWEVTTVQDENLKGKKDRDIIEYTKANDLILVTRDKKPFDIANIIGAKYFRITDAMIAEMASAKMKERFG